MTVKYKSIVKYSMSNDDRVAQRVVAALRSVVPQAVDVRILGYSGPTLELAIGDQRFMARWVGEGTLGHVRRLLAEEGDSIQVVVARLMSPGARSAASSAGVGWVDETGAAEIASGSLLISRTGRAPSREPDSLRWTQSVFAAAESLLCGTDATVESVVESTGLSMGASAKALRTLEKLDLLEADAARGRLSGRRVKDPRALLDAFSRSAASSSSDIRVEVGVSWQDAVDGLAGIGRAWDAAGTDWAASGQVAASVLAPLVTSVRSALVYIDAGTRPALETVAREVGLTPVEGGRLVLAPIPTVTTIPHSRTVAGVRVAPWPRVFADLQISGVRGEEAAEHLWEVIYD